MIKKADGFEFTNPGILKLPIEEIYKGGNSKARNPKLQTMLRMVGFGDNAGSGFPAILKTWDENGWVKPQLVENTVLNQVTLLLSFVNKEEKKSAMIFGVEIGGDLAAISVNKFWVLLSLITQFLPPKLLK